MTQEELEFLYRWVWVNEWKQPLKDFDDTPHEYIMGLFEARRLSNERERKKQRKGSRVDQMEENVRRMALSKK